MEIPQQNINFPIGVHRVGGAKNLSGTRIEPVSPPWKGGMITTTLTAHKENRSSNGVHLLFQFKESNQKQMNKTVTLSIISTIQVTRPPTILII